VAIVVTQENVTFYLDAKIQSIVNTSRPITDCAGRSLELGDNNIDLLGEVTFFARALNQEEMEEIMFAGFTFQSISVGKSIYTPERTRFDRANSKSTQAFSEAQGERSIIRQDTQVDGTLTRQITELIVSPTSNELLPNIVVPSLEGCPRITTFGASTSCHIMNLTEDDAQPDPTLSGEAKYFPFIKQKYMADGRRLRDPSYLGIQPEKEFLRYDSQQFPSWCRMSATFSIWFENWGSGGYLIARYGSSEEVWPSKG